MPVTLENEQLRVAVNPAYGGRVVSLFDKAGQREWLTQGGQSANTGEEAEYRSEEAVAWDECFPTVSPWDGTATPWGRRLRDHGDLWGRSWQVDSERGGELILSYTGAEFRFIRRLSLAGNALTAQYQVENLLDVPLPYLWAWHALLAVERGDRIELPGVERARASFLSGLPPRELNWPGGDGVLPFPLDEVQERGAAFAGKFLASGAGGLARVGRPGQWLEIAWDSEIRHLGVWLTYGGWFGHQEIAIEPTNAEADHLGQAIDAGAPPLPARGQREWWLRLRVRV